MLSTNPAERSDFFILPPEMSAHLFTRIQEPKDYASLSQTCKQLHAISRFIHVIACCSLRNRRFLLRYSLLSTPKLIDAAFALIKIKNADPLGYRDRSVSTRAAENQFYLVFKGLCKQLNVNEIDEEFLNCASDVRGLSRFFIGFRERKIYSDVIEAFTNQSIQGITISSLHRKINQLRLFLGIGNSVDIEMDVRQSLKRKQGGAFLEYAKKLQSAFPKEKIAKMEVSLRVQLEIEKAKRLKELQILDAPCGFYGSVEQADYLMNAASKARTIAHHALMEASGRTDISLTHVLNFKTSSPEIRAAVNELLIQNRVFCVAKDHYLRLYARLQKISAELLRIENKMENTHEIVLNRVSRLVRFYFELDQDVTDFNKRERHRTLWRIINAQQTSFLPHVPGTYPHIRIGFEI